MTNPRVTVVTSILPTAIIFLYASVPSLADFNHTIIMIF